MKKTRLSELFVSILSESIGTVVYTVSMTLLLLCMLPSLHVIPGKVLAQDNANSSTSSLTDTVQPAGSVQTTDGVRQVSDSEVKAVAQELWCPLCSGVRLDTCELKACEQMRQEIAIQLANGKDVESIKAYFLDQYGPQVLGEPPREGFNLLAWVVPFLVLVGAAGVLLFRSRRLLQQRTTQGAEEFATDFDLDEVSDDENEEDLQMASTSTLTSISTPASAPVHQLADSYDRALDEELRQYE